MHFLFTTLQTHESEFYGRVGAVLAGRGHRVSHVTFSRAAARTLRDARSLPDAMQALPPIDVPAEVARIEATYTTPSIRDVYRADWACEGLTEAESLERTVRHFRALERIFDELQPDVLVPEVGNETIRVASHLIALERELPVLFLFYTIFPRS